MNSSRLCVFLTHPNQHFSPLFKKLHEEPRLKLKVIYMFDHGLSESWDVGFGKKIKFNIPMQGNYETVVLKPEVSVSDYSFFKVNSSKLIKEVLKANPDYVWVFGYNSLASWKLVFYPFRKYKVCYLGDSSIKIKQPWWKTILKEFVLRIFFKKIDLIFSIGESNEQFYRKYSVSAKRICRAAYIFDNEYLLRDLDSPALSRSEVRKELKFDSNLFLIGFSGKFIERKRPHDVVELVYRLRKQGMNAGAVLIGDGKLRESIEKRIRDLEMDEWIRLPGFINQNRIGGYYNAIDTLCMPSSIENFGMSVIEAIAFGKPVLVSDKLGCVGLTDIARPDINALVFECGNMNMLTQQALNLIKDKQLYQRMSDESRRIAEKNTMTHNSQIISDALCNTFSSL